MENTQIEKQLATIHLEILRNQKMITAFINTLPPEQRQQFIQEYNRLNNQSPVALYLPIKK